MRETGLGPGSLECYRELDCVLSAVRPVPYLKRIFSYLKMVLLVSLSYLLQLGLNGPFSRCGALGWLLGGGRLGVGAWGIWYISSDFFTRGEGMGGGSTLALS